MALSGGPVSIFCHVQKLKFSAIIDQWTGSQIKQFLSISKESAETDWPLNLSVIESS
jgi:hypothetical protein